MSNLTPSLTPTLKKELDIIPDTQARFTTTEEIQSFLSSPQSDAIKVVVTLDSETLYSSDEGQLYELPNKSEDSRSPGVLVTGNILDTEFSIGTPTLVHIDSSGTDNTSTYGSLLPDGVLSLPFFVVTISCFIALFSVCCIATLLYIIEMLRSNIFMSTATATWGLLPPLLEKNSIRGSGQPGGVTFIARDLIMDSEKYPVPGALAILEITESLDPTSVESGPIEELDEKFFDAEWLLPGDDIDRHSVYMTPTTVPIDLPSSENAVPEMREITLSDTNMELSRSSWHARASEAGAIVRTPEPQDDTLNREGRRRAYLAVPELDAALAMQLRPGLGIGADAAWLVRFIMALFGWCAVLMSSATRRR